MSGRILNFSEFFGKYSKDTEKELGDFTQSAANFEEGFDQETYDQAQIGPNRPVESGSEATPPSPGETGAPAFTASQDEEMNAPEEEETEETEESDVPQPEAGANPEGEEEEEDKKEPEAMKESRKFKGVKGFSEFINERMDWGAEYVPEEGWDEEEEEEIEDPFAMYQEEEEEDEFGMPSHEEEYCTDCGEQIIGYSCGCNM